VFTSCGTEATNAAIHSALSIDPDRQHVVTTRVEHSATLKTCEYLAKRGVEVTWLSVDAKGQINLSELEKAVRPDTALVSVMWANNETGTVFPIAEIQEIVRRKNVFFHTDAVQAVGKLELNLGSAAIQFLSLSGHKLHCPKGVGALYVNRKTRFTPFLYGGSQENGKRGGTENLASIVALGKACELAKEKMEEEQKTVRALRDHFEQGILARISGVQINGDTDNRLPNTSNLAFEGVDGETLLLMLDQKQLCCSAGSACTSGSVHASHVLKAMGHSDSHARSSLRFSFSRFNSLEETNRALNLLEATVVKMRAR
jgi:cysteine desulfurase